METPQCSVHERSDVVRAGWYGRPGHRRQRWLCRPDSGDCHRFTEVLPRIVGAPVTVRVGAERVTTLAPGEGQPAPRLYGFTTKQVARALVLVAGGTSYRQTAAEVRREAGRELGAATTTGSTGRVLAAPTRHGQLVSDWVDVFAPVIWEAYAPTSWPPTLLLDDAEFRLARPGVPRGVLAFVVLVALGFTTAGGPLVVAIEAVPRSTVPAWEAFLRRLDGAPETVVTSRVKAKRAVAGLWPPPGGYVRDLPSSQWHLVTTRAPQGPPSSGPLEQFLGRLGDTVGHRAARLTNKARADALLTLLAAKQNGWANEDTWAELIGLYLLARRGRPGDQREHTDPAGGPSLRASLRRATATDDS